MKALTYLKTAVGMAAVIALAGCSGSSKTFPLFPAEVTAPRNADHDAGIVYSKGIGVPRDYERAKSGFERAAKLGDARAMNNLGVMALQGRGSAVSPAAAAGWFRKAVYGGSAAASYNLGLMSELGIGGGADVYRAAAEYRVAAAQGHPLAQRRLAVLLEGGRGLVANPSESKRLFEKSAFGGDREALARISLIDGMAKGEPEKAAILFDMESCDQCSSLEKSVSGRQLVELRKLAATGDAPALYNLGVLHLTGDGSVQDPAEAARLFTLAARAGYAPAARQLAQMHLRGQAVGLSKIQAHTWLNLAARDKGAEGTAALADLEALEASMTVAEIRDAQKIAAKHAAKGR